jgi:hypothetical protein
MGTWAGATGSARNDALRTLENGCRYPFLTMVGSEGLAQSTDNPGPHPDGNGEDALGQRSFVANLAGRLGGSYKCPAYSGRPQFITTSGAYVGSEDEVRNGVTYFVGGASLQLPNAALFTGQPVYLYSPSGATLTSAGTMYAENNAGTVASFSLKAAYLYEAYQLTGTAWYIQSVFSRVGNETCFASNGIYAGAQAFSLRNLSNACLSLSSATVTVTSGFGLQAQFYASSGTSTLSLASGTFLMPDGSTPTALTLLQGQTVTLVGIITTGNALLTEVLYDAGSVAPSTQYSQPTTGTTITTNSGFGHLTHVIDPAGTLAALTITLPSNPRNGAKVTYAATQAVTALTWSGGTLGIAQAGFTAGQHLTLTYVSSQGKWF